MFVDWMWTCGSRLETVPDPGSNTFFGALSCRLIGPIIHICDTRFRAALARTLNTLARLLVRAARDVIKSTFAVGGR